MNKLAFNVCYLKKSCNACQQVKLLSEYHIKRSKYDGRDSRCKECCNKSGKAKYKNDDVYREKQKERNYRPEIKEKNRIYARNRSKQYRQEEHRKRNKKLGKPYAPRIKLSTEKIQDRLAEGNAKQAWKYWLSIATDKWMEEYFSSVGKPWLNPRIPDKDRYKVRYSVDVEFQIRERIKTQIRKKQKRDGVASLMRQAINRSGTSPTVQALLGYTIHELKEHIESLFTYGMSWDSFKSGDIHIDHIMPQHTFNVSNDEEYRTCWALSNLQPLWAKDNINKGGKILNIYVDKQ